jgi:hypothetical protein
MRFAPSFACSLSISIVFHVQRVMILEWDCVDRLGSHFRVTMIVTLDLTLWRMVSYFYQSLESVKTM